MSAAFQTAPAPALISDGSDSELPFPVNWCTPAQFWRIQTMTCETNSERVVITLPVELREQVEQVAKKESISMSAVSRRALRRYLEQCAKSS